MEFHEPSSFVPLKGLMTTPDIHIPEHPDRDSIRQDYIDSISMVGTPELTSDDISPPTSAGPITPHVEKSFQAGVSSSSKQRTQLPAPELHGTSPTYKGAPNVDNSDENYNLSLEFGSSQNPQIASLTSYTPKSPSLPHRTQSDLVPPGAQVPQGLPMRTQSPPQVGTPAHDHPEGTPPATDTAIISSNLIDGDSQPYWTVDPFQNPTANERLQDPTLIPSYPPSVVESARIPLGTLLEFCLDTAPRQIYLHLLLRLPSLYFSRLTRIFRDAELSLPEMRKLALITWAQHHSIRNVPALSESDVNPTRSEAFANLKSNWEAFIESTMTEWKMNNIVSVLLLTAILTTLQIDGVSNDPVARNVALGALVCGLMGLLYGCLYIVRFGTMRKGYKAIQWAEEAQQTETRIFWNVWVFLAMPAVWLSWSIILFMTSIMAYLWRTGSTNDPTLQLSPRMALGPRLAVSGLFALGILYLGLIIFTLRRYGDIMDEKWKKRVASWVKENIPRGAYSRSARSGHPQPYSMMPPGFGQMPLPSTPISFAPTSHYSPWNDGGRPPAPWNNMSLNSGPSIQNTPPIKFPVPEIPAFHGQSLPTEWTNPQSNFGSPAPYSPAPPFSMSETPTSYSQPPPAFEWYNTHFLPGPSSSYNITPQLPTPNVHVPYSQHQRNPEWYDTNLSPRYSSLYNLPSHLQIPGSSELNDQALSTERYTPNIGPKPSLFEPAPLPPTPGTPSFNSPRDVGQPLPKEWYSPGFNPGFSALSRLPLDTVPLPDPHSPTQDDDQLEFSLVNKPVTGPSSLQITPVRLPADDLQSGPDPSILIPSSRVSNAHTVAKVSSPLFRPIELPSSGPMSGAQVISDPENTYKIIFPVVFREQEPDPFYVQVKSSPLIAAPDVPLPPIRIVDLGMPTDSACDVPEDLEAYNIVEEDWRTFITDMGSTWKNLHPTRRVRPQLNSEYLSIMSYPRRQDLLASFLHSWNELLFSERGLRAILCEEFTSDSPKNNKFAVYMTAYEGTKTPQALRKSFQLFTTNGLEMINVYPPINPTTPNLILVAELVLLNIPPVPKQWVTFPFPPFRLTPSRRLPQNINRIPIALAGWTVDTDALERFLIATENNRTSKRYPNSIFEQFTPFCEQLLVAWNTGYFWKLNLEAVRAKFPEAPRFGAFRQPNSWREFYCTSGDGPYRWMSTNPARVHF